MAVVDDMNPLISVDWGTSNLRAALVNDQGNIIEQVTSDQGLLSKPTDFAACLRDLIQPWLDRSPKISTVLSGMVGSPGGWMEVPHVACPANPGSLAAGAKTIDGFGHGGAWILPGVAGKGSAGLHEVMRGEEVQFFGAQQIFRAQGQPLPQCWCFPGTHHTWLSAGSDITDFSTSMVGEFFQLAQRHSLLSQSLAIQSPSENKADTDDDFLRGLATSQQPGGLLHHLFSVRTLQLSGAHRKAQGSAYLSGILVGHDIASQTLKSGSSIGIVAGPDLASRYQLALEELGYDWVIVDSQQATAQGALLVAKHL